MINGMCEIDHELPDPLIPVPEAAREALEILDRDGWCKGATTAVPQNHDGYRAGSHCLAGLMNKAIWGSAAFQFQGTEVYRVIGEKIRDMYGWVNPYQMGEITCVFSAHASYITSWNDESATEADVRAVLEKLAAD